MRRGLLIIVVFAALAVTAGITYAQVTGPTDVKTTSADELVPGASATWFAWTRVPADHPNRVALMVEPLPLGGGDAFRINEAGTRAWPGGFDGESFVYQYAVGDQSNIRLRNMTAGTESSIGAINTQAWEWHPTISTLDDEQWVLFGRVSGSGVERVVLYNLTTDVTRTLVTLRRERYNAYPGQVSGNYATWTVCNPWCNVRVHDITADASSTVPKPASTAHQYSSSVTADGTVYFMRSGNGCGRNVKLVRYEAGTRQTITSLPDGKDNLTTHVSSEADGNHVYYDQVGCRSDRWNIYQVVDAG
jgi:hypothetical protein